MKAMMFAAACLALAGPRGALAGDAEPRSAAATTNADSSAGLEYLVPSMEGAGYHVSNDPDRYRHRIWFSPGVGQLGDNTLFSFRAGFSPNTKLGYEMALGHNPAEGLHALLHTFNVVLRHPIPGRAQPYVTLGYGMLTAYPGQALNADPVTKNALTYGGGLELYLRDDIALRGEMRGATVLGQQQGVDGTVAYDYREYTIGFAFYRGLK